MREKGEQSLAESQRLQEELSQQEQALRTRKGDLVDREKQLALVSQLSQDCWIVNDDGRAFISTCTHNYTLYQGLSP